MLHFPLGNPHPQVSPVLPSPPRLHPFLRLIVPGELVPMACFSSPPSNPPLILINFSVVEIFPSQPSRVLVVPPPSYAFPPPFPEEVIFFFLQSVDMGLSPPQDLQYFFPLPLPFESSAVRVTFPSKLGDSLLYVLPFLLSPFSRSLSLLWPFWRLETLMDTGKLYTTPPPLNAL